MTDCEAEVPRTCSGPAVCRMTLAVEDVRLVDHAPACRKHADNMVSIALSADPVAVSLVMEPLA